MNKQKIIELPVTTQPHEATINVPVGDRMDLYHWVTSIGGVAYYRLDGVTPSEATKLIQAKFEDN